MPSVDYVGFIVGNLLAIFILLTTAESALLDQNCGTNSSCLGTGLICRNDICQCEAPWYKPCNGICNIQQHFVYAGAECRVEENCINNTRCDNSSKRCICKDSFSLFNGLCYKKYNETCTLNNECWSNNCEIGLQRCTCKMGLEPSNDGRCKRKLARLYANWEEANKTNDFCYDAYSCQYHSAVCKNDGIHSNNFCQCPDGYTTNLERQECDTIDTVELSPMNIHPSNDNTTTCQFCKDSYAVCAYVSGKKTCWCRAGYDKVDNQCKNIRYKFIFPNVMDAQMHSYASNCLIHGPSVSSSDNLCTCAAHYEYDTNTRNCYAIKREWISEYFEYGICTRITSDELAQGLNNALCPPPLQCQANGDKYVCSCDQNKFLESNSTHRRCVTRLGKPGVAESCPLNANLVNGTCQCKPGFKQVHEDRQCELVLEPQETLTDCDTNGPAGANDSCRSLFTGAAQYCRVGICRCSPSLSYANPILNRCYGLLDVPQAETYCPEGSQTDKMTTCQCKDEYRKSNDNRRCEPKSLLYDWNETAIHQPDLRREHCQNLYKGFLAEFNDTALEKACRCDQTAFKDSTRKKCYPNNPKRCECRPGYRPTNALKRDCVLIPVRLDEPISILIPGVNEVNDGDCRELFGILSVANNSRCVCRDSISFANNDRSQCLAFLNKPTGLNTLGTSSCPQNANISGNLLGQCKCNQGFITSPDNRTCATANIPLVGAKVSPSTKNCTNFEDYNCKVKYGSESFCENDQCWCNRGTSFKLSENKCEPFSKYIFPGLHERHNVSCDVDEDCASENVDVNTVECRKRTNTNDNYKVCVCKNGWLLNPSTQRCESRCSSDCGNLPNRECNGYICACKHGFREENGVCIPITSQIQLYKPCNDSFISNKNDFYQCSTCARGECRVGYKDIGFQCARYNFDTDGCVLQASTSIFCSVLIDNSECFMDENKCTCRSGYYRNGDTCVLAINSRCTSPQQCGSNAVCSGQRCQCGVGTREESIHDVWGRSMKRCVNDVDRIRFNLISSLFFLFIRLFFV